MAFEKDRIPKIYLENEQTKMIRDDIQKILGKSVQAPSGSNSQPWAFKVRGNAIEVVAFPGKDHPVLNFRWRGTWIAHGALIENIKIAASELGYGTKITLWPEAENKNLTARIILEKNGMNADPLSNAIPKRATNRKPYKIYPLAEFQKKSLENEADHFPGIYFKIIEDPLEIKALGRASSANEIIMLEDKYLHSLFFHEIVWKEREFLKKGTGFYVNTMELKTPQKLALHLLRYWPVMSFLNKLNFSKFVAKDNEKMYCSAPAVGAIIVKNDDIEFLKAGRLLERIWLTLASQGLSLHLMTGVLFFWQKIKAGETGYFSEEHQKIIEDSYRAIADIIKPGDNLIALLFRMGNGGEPTAYSFKKPPEISYS